jgi:hypothetical protein
MMDFLESKIFERNEVDSPSKVDNQPENEDKMQSWKTAKRYYNIPFQEKDS